MSALSSFLVWLVLVGGGVYAGGTALYSSSKCNGNSAKIHEFAEALTKIKPSDSNGGESNNKLSKQISDAIRTSIADGGELLKKFYPNNATGK